MDSFFINYIPDIKFHSGLPVQSYSGHKFKLKKSITDIKNIIYLKYRFHYDQVNINQTIQI